MRYSAMRARVPASLGKVGSDSSFCLEATAIVIEIDTDKLADFYVLIRLPPRV